MKNIDAILKQFGVEIPDDKKAEFEKSFSENYKTVSELENVKSKLTDKEHEYEDLSKRYDKDISKRDKDLEKLQGQLKDATEGNEKLESIQAELKKSQEEYANAKTEWDKQLATMKYESLVKEKVTELKFTSNGAKKSFIADVMAKQLPVENGTLLGFDDFVNTYKESDAGAFVVEDDNSSNPDNPPVPQFSSKNNGNNNPAPVKDEKRSSILI